MKKIFALLILAPFLTSCEKMLFEDDMSSGNARDNFEYLWKECDRKYSYFDYKGIDWDQVYNNYSAQIYDDMPKEELFDVLGNMLNELRDGHVNVLSDFNVSTYDFNLNGPKNFDQRLVDEFYLGPNSFITGPFRHNFIANDSVGYIRFASFTGTVTDDQLDFILNKYANTKGLILDLRSNGGGVVNDMYKILSHFVTSSTLIFRSQIKNGPGHEDFASPEDAMVDPASGVIYSGKVMVLTDRGTFSAGSFTSLSTLALPNMVLVGDTTGGGLGLPNGGQLPNGWTYRFSVTRALDLSGNNFENGVPPDIYVVLNPADVNNNIDTVIERAVQEIL
jgi:C-terminal processing protease CtpA/Prc